MLPPSLQERGNSRAHPKLAMLSQGWKSTLTGISDLGNIRWVAWGSTTTLYLRSTDGFPFQEEVKDGQVFPVGQQWIWQKEEPA